MKTIKCLDHGFVTLVDSMGNDSSVVQAARVSYGAGTKTVSEDRDLIRYLYRHRHTTPFEMVEFKFHVKLPIFVARQWIRTRTANVNEQSLRYSEASEDYYIPEVGEVRTQSTKNKQGSEGTARFDVASGFVDSLAIGSGNAQWYYKHALESGVSREQARIGLPLNLYTEWYWKIDLHNLLQFLAQRLDPHAQEEIRVYARAILEIITPIVPVTVEAWNDYHPMRGALVLTALEVAAISTGTMVIDTNNKREQQEWDDKRRRLGI